MTAQAFLRDALRDVVGPNARAHGFAGSAPTWRRSTAAGDWAVVNVQSSSFSSADRLHCVVNMAVAPEPWLRWSRQRLGEAMPKFVNESLGLYRDRLHPTGTPPGVDGWWEVTDRQSAVAAASDVVTQLEASGWPVLKRLLVPGGMLDQVRDGDLGKMKRADFGVFFARAEALLLMDQVLGEELEANLQYALEQCTPAQRENALRFDHWVREQALRGS